MRTSNEKNPNLVLICLAAEKKAAQITDLAVNDECIFASNSDGK